MLYTLLFFSSKCSLFHNANLFGSYIIHILYTGCAKIKKNNSGAKGLSFLMTEPPHCRGTLDYLLFLISDFRRDLNIENVLLGISPASICSWPINLNLWRYDFVFPWPETIAVNSDVIDISSFSLCREERSA